MQRRTDAGFQASKSSPGSSSATSSSVYARDSYSMHLGAHSTSRLATKQGTATDTALYRFPTLGHEYMACTSSNGIDFRPQIGYPSIVHAPAPRPARISKLLNAVLSSSASAEASGSRTVGAPFLAGHRNDRMPFNAPLRPRAPSPAPTADYSFVSPPSPMSFVHILPSDINSDFNEYSDLAPLNSGPDGTPQRALLVSSTGSARRSPRLRNKAAQGCQWLLGALSYPTRRGRAKSRGVFDLFDEDGLPLPLDGEEGELIDEACFVATQTERADGMDIIGRLPPEIALYIFSFLDFQSVLTCRNVSHLWKSMADDNAIWRDLFYREVDTKGWRINEKRARLLIESTQDPLDSQNNSLLPEAYSQASQLASRMRLLSLCSASSRLQGSSCVPLLLDWMHLFRTRTLLDARWARGEPRITRISGHADSVYCLELDTRHLVTGARDRTIKIWDVRTGSLRATLRAHAGSVLCVKYDRTEMARMDSSDGIREADEEGDGLMVSGSSDCTVLVWDLRRLWRACAKSSVPIDAGPELVRSVLRGHTGGVLDLRIDKRWIISCSKDTTIRVWDRKTLTLQHILTGHEGPVNAIGLQGNRLASASGEGKMMLWDIAAGTRLRTFEGTDRGLACIDFKGDFIVSGSNDCKIKVWCVSTGKCIQTLSGHTSLVRALAFDPRTQRLVSASYDCTVKVWDLASGRVVREFRSHESHIFDVKFDVRRIVSTSHDQKIIMLDFGHELDTSLLM